MVQNSLKCPCEPSVCQSQSHATRGRVVLIGREAIQRYPCSSHAAQATIHVAAMSWHALSDTPVPAPAPTFTRIACAH